MCAIPRATAHDRFDHVLIDMNQLLHICLRKSRSEGHALTLLMKELDDCCRMATPTKSLVLAMDGPPSASKLATQRQRRLQTIVRNERKLQQIDQLSSNGKRVFSKAKQNRKRRRYEAETQTLRITPGTDFMVLTERAILYWAWQRMQNNNPHHYLSKVKVYISPSTVAGEGEVKLLEWVLRQRVVGKRGGNGESIAILGGDSDLVLEGLVIPPSFSHNVFVLLPDGNRKYLSVSLWETTRTLAQFLPKDLPSEQFLRVRTDLVLLLILNGNDYFPKLRGSSGFHKVFHTYLRTLRDWLAKKDPEHHPPFLVEPESLTYNLPFCIAFFRHLEKSAPQNLLWRQNSTSYGRTRPATPLARFNSLVDAGFFPKPIRWKMVEVNEDEDEEDVEGDDEEENNKEDEEEDLDDDIMEDSDDEDEDDDDDEEDEDEEEDEMENEMEEDDAVVERQNLYLLKIGRPGTEDYVCYEIWQPRRKTLKRAKHKLAKMALEDLFGDIGDYFDTEKEDTVVDSYAWDIGHAVEGKADDYLGGLLWNLQTYQDGVCADYAFNYGKRLAPTAGEIVHFLKEAQEKNTELGLVQLMANSTIGAPDSYPISAGVSCLAALPSQVRDLVPEPYRNLDVDTVEDFYGQCMDPNDNVFNIKRFERLCDEKVVELGYVNGKSSSSALTEAEQMDIANYWIVLSKSRTPLARPIQPPPPFSERLSELKPNNRIRVSRVKAIWGYRQRAIWEKTDDSKKVERKSHKQAAREHWEQKRLNQAQPDRFLSKFESLEDVKYKRAYQKEKKIKPKRKMGVSALEASLNGSGRKERKKKKRKPVGVTERMLEYEQIPLPKKYATTADGQSAIACLKQLQDAELIGCFEWKSAIPSTSAYASFNPEDHELVSLAIPVGSNRETNILPESLYYEQDRDVNHVSKQAIKQHLATFALCDIVGPKVRWSELSFKDLKTLIVGRSRFGVR